MKNENKSVRDDRFVAMLSKLSLCLIGICLVFLASASQAEEGLKTKRFQQAKALAEQYFKLEDARGYERIYDLLSSKSRQGLSEGNVKNGQEYKKLRGIQGLRWEKFKVTNATLDTQLNAIVSITAKYAQQVIGEHIIYGKVDLAVIVVWENEKPFIDSITLIKVH